MTAQVPIAIRARDVVASDAVRQVFLGERFKLASQAS